MAAVPALASKRLVLRGWEDGDLLPYRALRADPAVARYLGNGQPLSADDADRQIDFHREQWQTHGVGRWAVEERASGTLIGYCGLLPWEEQSALELGYGFVRSAWGRGYATEAARTAIRWGLDQAAAGSIVATTHPDNLASQRVLARLGFALVEEVEGQFHSLRLFRLSVPDSRP